MTAEIVILNQYGVALAADSAVSIGNKKVYNSANKLFSLSRHHPVGVMIYGNAKFMTAPWEVLIKYFRQNVLKERSFERLSQYSSLFLDFLAKTPLIPDENEVAYMVSMAQSSFEQIYKNIKKGVEARIKEVGRITKTDTKLIAVKVVDDWLESDALIQGQRQSSPLPEQIKMIRSNYFDVINGKVREVFLSFGIGVARANKISNAVISRLTCESLHGSRSGVVIAGFGEADLYPSAESYEISGRACGYLCSTSKAEASIGLDQGGFVMPFAQREMADTFIGGIDPGFQRVILKGISESIRAFPELLLKSGVKLTAKQKKLISDELEGEVKRFSGSISRVQQEHFANPVLASVAALPIDELAAMAESLVSLTSFKRKVTMVPESVGGPVDVAVISKGDGFIWIKRKHYFSPELNQQYFSRTFR